MKGISILLGALLLLIGCTTVSISSRSFQGPLNSIMIVSSSPEAAQFLEQELTASKFSVFRESESGKVNSNVSSTAFATVSPDLLGRLRDMKVDSYLQLVVVDGIDGKPDTVKFQLVYTPNARVVLSGTWENLYNFQLSQKDIDSMLIEYFSQGRSDLRRAIATVSAELKRQIPTSFWQ